MGGNLLPEGTGVAGNLGKMRGLGTALLVPSEAICDTSGTMLIV